ncbi:hypothetical protein PR003_g12983 [Phytophthora rubi]|uniref:Uncharacterized protein n=1 Tax=Phytophthora rubi TaxID=129364 RepID=A0A6A4EYL8_9STRA|nr:hypothetical protein PR003_g12983 [Phytophthora rubi]
MHELDVDTLVLASAGIFADEIDWTLLGLNPPDVIVGSPQSSGGSSSLDEPSTEASSTSVVPRSSPPASPSSASFSSKRKRDSSPRSSTEAAAAQRASGSPGGQQASVASPSPSAALGSPGGESTEGSDASLIPASSPSSASPPSPAASVPPPVCSDSGLGQASPLGGGDSPGDADQPGSPAGGSPPSSGDGGSPSPPGSDDDKQSGGSSGGSDDSSAESDAGGSPSATPPRSQQLAASSKKFDDLSPESLERAIVVAWVFRIRSTIERGFVYRCAAGASPSRGNRHSLGAPGTMQTGFTPAVTSVADVAEGSRKVSELGYLFLLPGFTAPGAQECWCLLQNLSVPDIPVEDLVSPCSEFQGTPTDATEKADLGFALWERRHWVKVSAIEAYFDELSTRHGRRNPTLLKLRRLWQEYSRGRNYRADRLRQQMMKRLWTGCIEYNREPRQFHTETLLEPSYLQNSFEVLEWTPRTSDWVAEITELDARQPRRNCWIDDPASHPLNTTFAACNPAVPLFVLREATSEEVAASVVVEPTLPASPVSAPWVTQFGAGHDDDASDEKSKDSLNLGAATP